MVDREVWGELKERLSEYTGDVLSDLCYLLDLHYSGLKDEKIHRILASEYDLEYVRNRLSLLDFGLELLDYFPAKDLTDIINEYNLPNPRKKWDKMIEIVKSEKVAPRVLLGQLTTDELEEIYYGICDDDDFDDDVVLDREGLIRGITDVSELEWLEDMMDLGFIMMAIGKDSALERTYQVIKDECEKFDIYAVRVDEVASSGEINEEALDLIRESEYLFVDLTHERPNVYYELGYCHGVGKKPEMIILMARKGTKLHFDISTMRTIMYETEDQLRKELRKRLEAIKQK